MTQMYYMERNKNKINSLDQLALYDIKATKNNTEYYENVKG